MAGTIILRTAEYTKRAAKLLPYAFQLAMEDAIANTPEAHPVVPHTGGLRKARWARPGTGKSGGVRTLYYYQLDPATVLFITIYAKNQQENISDADKKRLAKIVRAFTEGGTS
ncbi:MAG: type II toxin-antitoxin system RelE/ParE family toxin [Acidobacteria bacterium]|nr:type II toxin-antitoxin system RelE/ParE family toxin [Acidobacteriota bacterium]